MRLRLNQWRTMKACSVTVDFSSLRICVTMSVREYECVPCVRDRVNKCTPTDNTQCDSRHARTLMVTQIRSELKSTVCRKNHWKTEFSLVPPRSETVSETVPYSRPCFPVLVVYNLHMPRVQPSKCLVHVHVQGSFQLGKHDLSCCAEPHPWINCLQQPHPSMIIFTGQNNK